MKTIRKSYTKDLHILITEKQLESLKRLAEAHGLPLSSYIRFILFTNRNLIAPPQK